MGYGEANVSKLKFNHKIWIPILIILEIITVFIIQHCYTKKDLFQQTFSASDLIIVSDSIGAAYSDAGITAFSPEQVRLEDAEIMSCGPYIPLKKGSYDITINYTTDTDGNRFEMHCGNTRDLDSVYASDKDGYFPAASQQLICQIRVLKDIEAFDVQTLYYGVGTFSLHSISIQQTNEAVKYYVLRWVLLLLLLDVILLCHKKVQQLFSKENYKYSMALGMLIVFSSLLIFVFGYYPGHDINFHLLRIEGLKEAILSGQFPAKLHPTHLRGYGYATGTMYPELFLYIPAVLRILCVDLINAYKIFILFVNAMTVLITFYSLRRIFQDKAVAFAGTVMYVLAPYRMLDLYYRAAVGEYCAFMGLPLIAYGLYSFVKAGNKEEGEGEEPDWLALALGYSIIVETHVISIVIVAIFSVIVGILCIKAFLNKKSILALLKMTGCVIAFNAWFIVPFLDYFRLPMNSASDSLNTYGISFAQLFTHQVLTEFPMHSVSIEEGSAGEPPYAIGYAIIFTVVAFIIFVRGEKKHRKLGIISLIAGAVSCIFALYQFPWDSMITKLHLGKILSNIQFPWRFLEIMVIAFVICGCVGMEYLFTRMHKTVVIAAICIIAVMGFSTTLDAFLQKDTMRTYIVLDTNELGTLHEYALDGTDANDLKKEGEKLTPSSEMIQYDSYRKKGTNLYLSVSSKSDAEQYIDVPLLMYPGYVAKDVETGERLAVTYGHNNVVRVMIPKEYQGNIRVSFAGKWYWNVACFLSIISVIGVMVSKRILKK